MYMYVDWYSQEILTKKEFDERVKRMIENDTTFSEFLEYEYSSLELFEMREESRLSLLEEFFEWAMGHTELGNFDEVEIEIGFPDGAILLVPKK